MTQQEVFDADLNRLNSAFERAGAVKTGTDAGGETFQYIDTRRAHPDLVRSYRRLLQFGAANGLIRPYGGTMTHPNIPQETLAMIRAAGILTADDGQPITAGALADWLATLPRDLPIVLPPVVALPVSDDGNASPAAEGSVNMYLPTGPWNGKLYLRDDERKDNPGREEHSPAPADAVPAVYLAPAT